MTAWNDFTKKIFAEGKKRDPTYMFKDALKEASKRKNEMVGQVENMVVGTSGKSKRRSGKSKKRHGKKHGTRKNKKHRKK